METEAKFIIPDEVTFTGLSAVAQLGPYMLRDTSVKRVHDRYVDTADSSFYNHNFFARLREVSDGGLLLTIKGLGGVAEGAIHSREEHEAQVHGLEVSSWPDGEVRSIAEQVAGSRPLKDLFTIDQTRIVSHLCEKDRIVAEMSLDNVTIYGPDEPVTDYELEIELQPEGLMSDLRILSRIMTEQYNLTPQPKSKFERAMEITGSSGQLEPQRGNTVPMATAATSQDGASAAGPHSSGKSTTNLSSESAPDLPGKKGKGGKAKIGVLPTDSALIATRKIVGAHFKEMLAHEQGTSKGKSPKELHDMRVATRRMRAVFRVLGSYLGKADVADVLKGLRDLAHAQGAARDLDVLIEHAQEFRKGLPDERQGDMNGLIDAWCSNCDRAQKELVALLDSKEYTRFKREMQAFLDDDRDDSPPRTSPDVKPYQVRHVAGSALWDRYEAVRAYETVMDAPTLDQLHALRITGKYLRYTLECFQEVLGSDADTLIKDVVEMQDQLGQLHDADVAAGLIREYMAKHQRKAKKGKKGHDEASPEQDHAHGQDGLAAYLEEREQAIRSLSAEFGPTWRTLSSVEWRKRLAVVVAAI